MRWLFDNKIENATISVLTENPDYPFNTALKDSRLSRYGRTLDISDQTIVFDLGAAYDVSYIVIFGHNITSSATVKIQANSSDSWTTPPVDETITVADVMIYHFSTDETYRYWRLYIDDDSNTDGYIQIAKVFIGDYLQLPYMSKSKDVTTTSNSTSSDSESGQSYMNIGLDYKAETITFPFVSDAQYTNTDAAFRLLHKFKPFIMLVWENDLTFQAPLYVKHTADLAWKQIDTYAGRNWSLSFSFRETF